MKHRAEAGKTGDDPTYFSSELGGGSVCTRVTDVTADFVLKCNTWAPSADIWLPLSLPKRDEFTELRLFNLD